MAKFNKIIKIKTAVEKTSKRTMKAQHDTSADFGQLNVLKAKYLEAGYGEVTPWTYCNMEPLPQPTWGEVKFEQRIFLVPIRQIFKGFEDFTQDTLHIDANDDTSMIGTLPYATMGEIVKAITGEMTEVTSTDYYDVVANINGTNKYLKHTGISYCMHKILEQCGYKLRWNNTDGNSTPNMLRLLALAKVYLDYYWNNAYVGDVVYNSLKKLFERDNGNLAYSGSEIATILKFCSRVYYSQGYFMSAWDTPNHPNLNNQQSTFAIKDPNGQFSDTGLGASATNEVVNKTDTNEFKDPYLQDYDGNNIVGHINQWAINMLRSLTMYLKRNQLAGGAAFERWLARYGEVPEAMRLKKSRVIYKKTWGMNVSPVMSNSDTINSGSGAQLGQYAGYAYAISGDPRKRDKISFQTSEPCILLELLGLTPMETYTQGIDAENMVLTKLELPTPEFDNVGVDPVMAYELVTGDSFDELIQQNSNKFYGTIFGFLPRYAKFKEMRDTLSGNFTRKLYKNAQLRYTMQRTFATNQAMDNYVHARIFTLAQYADQGVFDRIFYSNSKEVIDNFRIHHEVEIEWYSWMKPLYDYYDWEHEGGKEITIQNNGPDAN